MLASPYQWAEGTFKLAVNFAYTTPFDGKLTDAYIAEARQVCQSQVWFAPCVCVCVLCLCVCVCCDVQCGRNLT